ncbi:putative eukaryotic translation initiation factor 5A [Paratrimastix pyriformis]|uniref:Eukaryotic translation initiation factor 5A n=1 Tax=Paratrimastix pyriformis TaxID=342808 RepID=A0ABQ8UHU4_9EUKA|nr:putative eukaryotic translation initiation factor 5A [Paratrimastix pyriformis]
MEDDDNQEFDSGSADSSNTTPIAANEACKKGLYMAMKGRPVKIVDISTSKTGKHGHAKMHITAIDIFNGKKYEELVPTSHNVPVPIVERNDYTLVTIGDDGFLTLMSADNETREDLKLPEGELADQIRSSYDEANRSGKQVSLTVYKAMGIEQVMQQKIID